MSWCLVGDDVLVFVSPVFLSCIWAFASKLFDVVLIIFLVADKEECCTIHSQHICMHQFALFNEYMHVHHATYMTHAMHMCEIFTILKTNQLIFEKMCQKP